MKTLLRMSLAAAAVLCLLSVGTQTPAGDAVSDFDYAVDVVERAYAGYPDKTAGREAKYAALKGRLQRRFPATVTSMMPLPNTSAGSTIRTSKHPVPKPTGLSRCAAIRTMPGG